MFFEHLGSQCNFMVWQAAKRRKNPKAGKKGADTIDRYQAAMPAVFGHSAHTGFRGRGSLRWRLTIDFKILKSAGGTDHPDNIQLLCHHCNSIKGNRPMEYLQTRVRLWESSR